MIDNKLKRLEENLRILSSFKNDYSLEDVNSNKVNEWSLRYGLLESIQIIIDISCSLFLKKISGCLKIIPNV